LWACVVASARDVDRLSVAEEAVTRLENAARQQRATAELGESPMADVPWPGHQKQNVADVLLLPDNDQARR
jgi:hypothetical protein